MNRTSRAALVLPPQQESPRRRAATSRSPPLLPRFDSFDAGSRMAGTYRVSVVANGIESVASYVTLYWLEDTIFANGFEAD